MSNVSKNEMQEIGNMTPFMEMMSKDAVGAEQIYDFYPSGRISAIKKAIKVRNGSERTLDPKNKFSSQFVVEQALERYFDLIRRAVESINSIFTESEVMVILNANCSPVYNNSVGVTVAGMVAADFGIELLSDVSEGSNLHILIEKLIRLSPTQEAALVDMCERYWRNDVSLKDNFASMNFKFAEC